MPTQLERALSRPAKEMHRLGGLYLNRSNFYTNTLLPHVAGDSTLLWACSNQRYIMFQIKNNAEQLINNAEEIKADNPGWLDNCSIEPLPLADVWGRVFAFTPNDMSQAGRDQWNLDHFNANANQDRMETYDAPGFDKNFTNNQKEFTQDIMLYYSRLNGKLDEVNTIRKSSLDAGEIDAAEDIQGWLELAISGTVLALDYLGGLEMNYENLVNGPLSRKQKRRIDRRYNWVRATPINENIVRPIHRGKVPSADRPLLIRRTRAENISTM